MEISVNNEKVQTDAVTLRDLVEQLLGEAIGGVAVAVEGKIVPRGRWSEDMLKEGVSVMIIRATQGG